MQRALPVVATLLLFSSCRTVPGTAGDEFTAYFAALHAMDYQGARAIEAHYGADLHADVVTGLAALRRQWGN